jgi:hypothetical protein
MSGNLPHSRAPRQPLGEGGRHRRNADIGNHLDRKRGPEHRAGLSAGEIVGEETKRDRGKSCPDQGDHLGEEEMPINAVSKGLSASRGLSPGTMKEERARLVAQWKNGGRKNVSKRPQIRTATQMPREVPAMSLALTGASTSGSKVPSWRKAAVL